jgi:uncharacterized protein (TIGR02996 family)
MDDRRALMAAIIANPDEDTPRLALADWLDEHGDARDRARADFIRLQVAEARLPWREGAERERLARAARKLEVKNRRAWLAPLHALDRMTPASWTTFSRGLLAYLPIVASTFLKAPYQRGAADALAAVGVEHLQPRGPLQNSARLAASPALRWVAGLVIERTTSPALRALSASPNCQHLSELFLYAPRLTDADLAEFAGSTAMVRLRRFGVTAQPGASRHTARGLCAVLNSPRLPLLHALTVYDLRPKPVDYETILRARGAARLTHLWLRGPIPLASILCTHLRQLCELRLDLTTVTDADVAALLARSTLAQLMNLKLEGANPEQPRLSPDAQSRLVERFGPDVIAYSPRARRRGR